VTAMLLPGNLRVICPARRLAPLKASATMSAKLMPPPLPPGTNLPPATGRCARSLNCLRSEERRVGKECRSRRSQYHDQKKTMREYDILAENMSEYYLQ